MECFIEACTSRNTLFQLIILVLSTIFVFAENVQYWRGIGEKEYMLQVYWSELHFVMNFVMGKCNSEQAT